MRMTYMQEENLESQHNEKMKAEAPRDADGNMICPTCGKKIPNVITKNGRTRIGYDGDHYPTTWSERVKSYEAQPTAPNEKNRFLIFSMRM